MSGATVSSKLCTHCGGTGFQGDDACEFCDAGGWEAYEENGPEDLEDTLDRLLETQP